MESLVNFTERFRADVERKSGCQVHKKALQSKFNLNKGNQGDVFAYIKIQPTLGRFNIAAWEKHAKKAGVAHLADKRALKGMWGKPALVWYVKESDAESYGKALNIFSKICKER